MKKFLSTFVLIFIGYIMSMTVNILQSTEIEPSVYLVNPNSPYHMKFDVFTRGGKRVFALNRPIDLGVPISVGLPKNYCGVITFLKKEENK